MEVWREVPEFEGLYEVSNFGRLRSVGRWQLVSPSSKMPNGFSRYLQSKIHKGNPYSDGNGKIRAIVVGLRKDGRYHHRSIHDIVLTAFVGPRPHGYYGCHKDDRPINNRLPNLYWGTPAENCADKIRHGNQPRGEIIPWSKLSEEDVKFIRKNAGVISQSKMAERFGVGQPQISRIVNRREWVHV